MQYSINWTTAFKVGITPSPAKSQVFYNNKSGDSNSFRNNLADAVRSKESTNSVEEYNPSRESVKSGWNRLQERGKTRCKSQDYEYDDKEETLKGAGNTWDTLEEILLLLKQLLRLQQAGGTEAEEQADILEKAKTLLQQLSVLGAGTNNVEAESRIVNINNIMDTIGRLNAESAIKGSIQESSEIDALKDSINDLLSIYNSSHNKGQKAAAEISEAQEQVSTQVGENDEFFAETRTTEAIAGQKHERVQDKAITTEQHGAVDLENSRNSIMQQTAVQSSLEDEALQQPEEILGGEADAEKDVAEKEEKNSKNSENSSLAGQENSKAKLDMTKATQGMNPIEDMNGIKFDAYMDKTEPSTVSMENNTGSLQETQKFDIINQIVKKAELIIREDQPEMRMQLEPENLGKLTLKVAVERGLVIAKFTAESYEVKEIIESNLDQLRDMLQEKGIGVESFSVSVGNGSKEFNDQSSGLYWGNSIKTPARMSTSYDDYESYMQDGTGNIMTANPYSYHEGKFDHRA